jgi:hypothetical protein
MLSSGHLLSKMRVAIGSKAVLRESAGWVGLGANSGLISNVVRGRRRAMIGHGPLRSQNSLRRRREARIDCARYHRHHKNAGLF